MNFSQRQRGLSMLAILVILVLIGFFATSAIKLFPVYMESFTVKRAIESTVEEARANNWGRVEVKNNISRQFDVNRVEAIATKDVKITNQNGKVVIDATYEKRVPFMGNIDVVLKFDKLIFEI